MDRRVGYEHGRARHSPGIRQRDRRQHQSATRGSAQRRSTVPGRSAGEPDVSRSVPPRSHRRLSGRTLLSGLFAGRPALHIVLGALCPPAPADGPADGHVSRAVVRHVHHIRGGEGCRRRIRAWCRSVGGGRPAVRLRCGLRSWRSPANKLICERAGGGAAERPGELDPEVGPVAGGHGLVHKARRLWRSVAQ